VWEPGEITGWPGHEPCPRRKPLQWTGGRDDPCGPAAGGGTPWCGPVWQGVLV